MVDVSCYTRKSSEAEGCATTGGGATGVCLGGMATSGVRGGGAAAKAGWSASHGMGAGGLTTLGVNGGGAAATAGLGAGHGDVSISSFSYSYCVYES